jgi:hypothetical protein
MTKRPTTRLFVCALLVLPLCAPILAIAAPTAERDGTSEFRVFQELSQSVLLTSTGARQDHARQRPVAPSVFTLVPFHGAGVYCGRLGLRVENAVQPSLWAAGPRTGRGPPIS